MQMGMSTVCRARQHPCLLFFFLRFLCFAGLTGHVTPSMAAYRIVLSESTPPPIQHDRAVSPQPNVVSPGRGARLDEKVGSWRSWRQHAAEDKSEVKRLRLMLTEAEEDVEVLNDRLIDARQAQERANHALKDKDERLANLMQQLATLDATRAELRGLKASRKTEISSAVQPMRNEIARIQMQAEVLSKTVLLLQGQLHESEQTNEQLRLEEDNIRSHFEAERSQFEAEHIIELVSAKEAYLLAVRDKETEQAARKAADAALARERELTLELRKQVRELEMKVAAEQESRQCADLTHAGIRQRGTKTSKFRYYNI